MTSRGFQLFSSIQFVTWRTQDIYQADRALCGGFLAMMFTRNNGFLIVTFFIFNGGALDLFRYRDAFVSDKCVK